MKPMELISLLDSGMVEELKMYYNGKKIVVNIRNLPETMPDYKIGKIWNSEDGNGISILLADDFVEDKTYTVKCCDTCKHKDKLMTQEPCFSCETRYGWYEKWEAKDDTI